MNPQYLCMPSTWSDLPNTPSPQECHKGCNLPPKMRHNCLSRSSCPQNRETDLVRFGQCAWICSYLLVPVYNSHCLQIAHVPTFLPESLSPTTNSFNMWDILKFQMGERKSSEYASSKHAGSAWLFWAKGIWNATDAEGSLPGAFLIWIKAKTSGKWELP